MDGWADFLYGFVAGVTIGFIAIFCISDRNVPYRQKIGLLAGIMVSSFVGMLQVEGKGGTGMTSGRQHGSIGTAVTSGSEGGGSIGIGSGSGSILLSDSDSPHRHLRFQ